MFCYMTINGKSENTPCKSELLINNGKIVIEKQELGEMLLARENFDKKESHSESATSIKYEEELYSTNFIKKKSHDRSAMRLIYDYFHLTYPDNDDAFYDTFMKLSDDIKEIIVDFDDKINIYKNSSRVKQIGFVENHLLPICYEIYPTLETKELSNIMLPDYFSSLMDKALWSFYETFLDNNTKFKFKSKNKEKEQKKYAKLYKKLFSLLISEYNLLKYRNHSFEYYKFFFQDSARIMLYDNAYSYFFKEEIETTDASISKLLESKSVIYGDVIYLLTCLDRSESIADNVVFDNVGLIRFIFNKSLEYVDNADYHRFVYLLSRCTYVLADIQDNIDITLETCFKDLDEYFNIIRCTYKEFKTYSQDEYFLQISLLHLLLYSSSGTTSLFTKLVSASYSPWVDIYYYIKYIFKDEADTILNETATGFREVTNTIFKEYINESLGSIYRDLDPHANKTYEINLYFFPYARLLHRVLLFAKKDTPYNLRKCLKCGCTFKTSINSEKYCKNCPRPVNYYDKNNMNTQFGIECRNAKSAVIQRIKRFIENNTNTPIISKDNIDAYSVTLLYVYNLMHFETKTNIYINYWANKIEPENRKKEIKCFFNCTKEALTVGNNAAKTNNRIILDSPYLASVKNDEPEFITTISYTNILKTLNAFKKDPELTKGTDSGYLFEYLLIIGEKIFSKTNSNQEITHQDNYKTISYFFNSKMIER